MTEPRPRPAYAFLDAYVKDNRYSYNRFAQSIGYDTTHVTNVCKGTAAISAELALAVSKAHPSLGALDLLIAQARHQLWELAETGPKRNRTRRQPGPPGPPLDEDEVVRDRKGGMAIRAIARKYHSNYSAVRKVLVRRGFLPDSQALDPPGVTPHRT